MSAVLTANALLATAMATLMPKPKLKSAMNAPAALATVDQTATVALARKSLFPTDVLAALLALVPTAIVKEKSNPSMKLSRMK